MDPSLLSVIRPGVLAFDGVRVAEDDSDLDARLREAEETLRRSAPPELGPVREMYRKVGIDPTRRRPSSEALLRRVMRGEPLPRINTLVDVCNWCSAELQLPYGVYDRDQIEGDVTLRIGAPGDRYAGIRKDEVHVGGRLTLVDRLGPFGNPTSDSARTMVGPRTTSVLAVIFAPSSLAVDRLQFALELTSTRVVAHTGGHRVAAAVV